MSLVISVSWLGPPETPSYHGTEWPPAPLRVFQAFVASAGRRGGSPKERAFDVLRQMETTPSPTIFTPPHARGTPVASAVPNNDGDVVWKHLDRGNFERARRETSKRQTIRNRQGRRVEGSVHYLWEAEVPPDGLSLLEDLARGITHIGLGIDLAAVRVSQTATLPEGNESVPDNQSANVLQVPYPGVLDALERRYQHERHRIATEAGQHRVSDQYSLEHRMQGYSSSDTMKRNRFATFRLTSRAAPHSEPPERALPIAAMLRHAVGEAAQQAGFSESTIAEIMGHGGIGRIHSIPLPNVGHAWADGKIRRVMVTAGQHVPTRVWDAVVRRLAGRTLRPADGEQGVEIALEPIEDAVTQWFTGESSCWTTATPAILAGRDHRRGKPRPKRAIRRLLRFAGIPEQAVDEVHLEPTGTVPGTRRPRDTRVPVHLRQYPVTHLTIHFARPVEGPLYVGAGIGWGLGLLVRCER